MTVGTVLADEVAHAELGLRWVYEVGSMRLRRRNWVYEVAQAEMSLLTVGAVLADEVAQAELGLRLV